MQLDCYALCETDRQHHTDTASVTGTDLNQHKDGAIDLAGKSGGRSQPFDDFFLL